MNAKDAEHLLDLTTVIEANRDEAKALLAVMTKDLPGEINAVAALMAGVDVLSATLFGSIDAIHARKGVPLHEVAKEGVQLLQELLNIRMTYELAQRGVLACDCPQCREEEQAVHARAPISVKLH